MSSAIPAGVDNGILARETQLIDHPGCGTAPPRPKTASPWPWSRPNPIRLASVERTLWEGGPSFTSMIVRLYHIRAVAAYGVLLTFADLIQAKLHGLTLWPALQAMIPGMLTTLGAVAIFAALAWCSARTTRYTITTDRVIMQCGLALPKTISIPLSQIIGIAVRVRSDGIGDVTLKPRPGSKLMYLKLWPFTRPWHFSAPEPMLRNVPSAGYVGSMLGRSVATAAQRAAAHDDVVNLAKQ